MKQTFDTVDKKEYFIQLRKAKLTVLLLLLLLLIFIIPLYYYIQGGVRRRVTKHDYKVMESMFASSLPESFVIERAYVKRYKRSIFPGADADFSNSESYYAIIVRSDDFSALLNNIEHTEMAISGMSLELSQLEKSLGISLQIEKKCQVIVYDFAGRGIASTIFIAKGRADTIVVAVSTYSAGSNMWLSMRAKRKGEKKTIEQPIRTNRGK